MADDGSKTRLRRTRTGCLKCRTRRRKCDEGKPSCRRCLNGGFECQYGTRLSFLEKNAMTVTDSTPIKKPKSSYTKLRFVEPESIAVQASPPLQREETSKSPSSKSSNKSCTHDANQCALAEGDAQDPASFSDLLSPSLDTFPVATPGAHSNDRSVQDLQPSNGISFEASPGNAAYETALNVLVSLGNDDCGSTPPSASQVILGSPSSARNHSVFAHAETASSRLPDPFLTCAHLPQDRVVQLLRHFRYNIAPCLDIGDSSRTFGLVVSRMAMESIPVLESLLALSATSLDPNSGLGFREWEMLPTTPGESGMNVIHSLLIMTFDSLRRFTAQAATGWQSPFNSISFPSFNSALFHEQHPNVNLAIAWVMLRLDVSVGLFTGSPVSIPDLLPYGVPSINSGFTPDSLKFAREPLFLCARVLNHCFGQEPATSSDAPLGPSKSQSWKALSESLNFWYSNRPQEFKPMLEVDVNDQLFPLVLFTNEAAIQANQLYHTSMLLLLQNRPRTMPAEHGRAVHKSPLWHAQRICGISLNNDNRTGWDFSLVASFYLGARRMTYEPQQQDILKGIDRLGTVTGWNTQGLALQLIQEWQPD